jgi:hypothetical protein
VKPLEAMGKESDHKRVSKGSQRESLPIRRKVSRERAQSTAEGNQSKAEGARVPEIRISAPTDAENDESGDDDDNPFISIGIDLGTTLVFGDVRIGAMLNQWVDILE